jgi:hypothetical protein
MDKLIDDIAAASAAYGVIELANWVPSDRHADLLEVIHDIVVSAITAFKDVGAWREPPPPSKN